MRVAVILALVLPHAIFGIKMMNPAEEPKPADHKTFADAKSWINDRVNEVGGNTQKATKAEAEMLHQMAEADRKAKADAEAKAKKAQEEEEVQKKALEATKQVAKSLEAGAAAASKPAAASKRCQTTPCQTVEKYLSSMKVNDVAGMLSTMSDNAKVTIHRPFKKHANTVLTDKAVLEAYFTANHVILGKEGNYREEGETIHSSKVKLSEPRKVVTHAKVKVPKVGWIVIQSVFLLSNDNIIQSIDHHPKIVIPVIPPH